MYKNIFPPIGNIIHASDSIEDNENELILLYLFFNENIINFTPFNI
jgi:hypothetical protein